MDAPTRSEIRVPLARVADAAGGLGLNSAVTPLNEIRAAVVEKGMIKGAA